MPAEVQIKQFDLSEQEALLAFLREAYPDDSRKSDPEVWKWHYLENPYISADNIPLWIVKDGDRVVGQAATILVELKVGTEVRNAVWLLDFILLPEYRGQRLGKRLVQFGRKTYPTMMALGYNQMSGNVFMSLDWVPMGKIDRYQRLLFPGHGLKEIAAIAPLRSLVNLAYAPFRPSLSETSTSDRYAIRTVVEFDSSFDELCVRASKAFPCAVLRSSSFLNWQFRLQPGKKFEVLGLYEHELLVGYVVLFFRKPQRIDAPPKAAITDICYDPEHATERIDQLLKAALRQSVERRAGSLVTDVRDSIIAERLRLFGFFRIKQAPPFIVCSADKEELMYQPSNWFLTRADSDVSIFEDPNL